MTNSPIFIAIALSLAGCNSSEQTTAAQTNATQTSNSQTTTQSNTIQAEQVQNSQATVNGQANKTGKNLLQGVSATVYKDANCGCCTGWMSHAANAGLTSSFQHPQNLTIIKERYEVPPEMQSCHTTVTSDGYVFEGHIPAKFMARFLDNPPSNAIGLAVPSMPVGSPGMEYDNQFMPYKVFQLNKDGSYQVYASVDAPEQQI